MGRNNNVNNIGEEVKKVPAEIGSLIYYDTNPALRNNVQKKAMEESGLGIPIILVTMPFTDFVLYILFLWDRLVHGILNWWKSMCRYCTGSPYVGSGLDVLADD